MKHKKFLIGILSSTPLLTLAPLAMLSSACVDKPEPNNFEGEGKLGIKIANKAQNGLKIKASKVVQELKEAQKKSWDEVLKVFQKYDIKYDLNNAPEGAKYSIADATHAHDDEGMFHLDIVRELKGETKKERWSVYGFEKEEIEDTFTIGNYKISSKSKKSEDPDKVLVALKEAQAKDFTTFLTKLKEYVDVEQIDTNNKTAEFGFDFDEAEIHKHEGQIHFEKTYTYDNKTPNTKTPTEEYIMQGLTKSH